MHYIHLFVIILFSPSSLPSSPLKSKNLMILTMTNNKMKISIKKKTNKVIVKRSTIWFS